MGFWQTCLQLREGTNPAGSPSISSRVPWGTRGKEAKRPETVYDYSLRLTSTGVVSTIWSWFTQARTM
jgi:hypothetical protein